MMKLLEAIKKEFKKHKLEVMFVSPSPNVQLKNERFIVLNCSQDSLYQPIGSKMVDVSSTLAIHIVDKNDRDLAKMYELSTKLLDKLKQLEQTTLDDVRIVAFLEPRIDEMAQDQANRYVLTIRVKVLWQEFLTV